MFARRITRTFLLSTTMSGAVLVALLGPLAVRAAEDTKQQEQKQPHEQQTHKMPTSMAQLMKMDPEECMRMMDKQHKGHITKAEFMKFQEQLWDRMDRNRDKQVDRAEFTDAG